MAHFSKFFAFFRKYPIVRGMASYATLWPISCVIQQKIAGRSWDNLDWNQVLRFSLYGGLFTAPTLYGWVRISTIIWPSTNLKTALTKAVVEQITYGPAALICFFFGMSLLQFKSIEEAKEEVRNKFLPTWKVGFFVWPVFQTINFMFIPERNRVPYVSMCSLVWCIFLSYVEQLQAKKHYVVHDLLSREVN
ncbi:mpv17-like protein [Agrilus planipennis]|uniref:Mpv17-like protein n=1 Tax=Agrilus planipennis TaxID=224129 RepID=A0A1W4XSZ1_AGRPL|nr:mpv17-like protein [Agrilus planipennis]XP_025832099.1 mpv17-like protein [Agrilus planipennis]